MGTFFQTHYITKQIILYATLYLCWFRNSLALVCFVTHIMDQDFSVLKMYIYIDSRQCKFHKNEALEVFIFYLFVICFVALRFIFSLTLVLFGIALSLIFLPQKKLQSTTFIENHSLSGRVFYDQLWIIFLQLGNCFCLLILDEGNKFNYD